MSETQSGQTDVPRRPCPMCGELIPAAARKCRHCGEELRPMSTGDDRVAGMIPYKNPAALIAYYLGVFSVIPCFPIGIAAFVMGIIGLINVRREPQVRGTVHAWIGIVMGFLLGGLWTLVTIAGVVAAVLGSAG